MLEQLRELPGERLPLDHYFEDFERHSIPGVDGWKLEVAQNFQEPGNESWEASVRGDWEESIRLLEAGRSTVQAELREPPFPFHRVRIVQQPLTEYMEWELRSLLIRAEAGENICFLDAATNDALLKLPEVVVIGRTVAYEVLYSSDGAVNGARRMKDETVVNALRADIMELHNRGTALSLLAKSLTSTPT